MIKRKITSRALAIAIATLTFTIPFTNTVLAMDKTSSIQTYNENLEYGQENAEIIALVEQLRAELEEEDINVDELIKEIQDTKFESVTQEDINAIENVPTGRSIETSLVKKTSAWIVKNSKQVSKLLKKAGIDVTSKQVQTTAKATVALSQTVDNYLFKFCRKIAHPSKTDKQCRTAATIIRLAIPFI